MQRIDGRYIYAASDLNNFLECEHLTELDRLVALGEKAAPQREDAQAELIARKGDEHEQRYLATLRALRAGGITEFGRPEHSLSGLRSAADETIAAMERGDALIYQGTFFDGEFLGHPDFMRRIEVPSARRPWSYEVIDTKLALSTKPYFLIQLCNYSEHLARIQGTMPEYGYIVLGNGEEKRYRLNDYSAYYRHLKNRFLDFVTLRLSKGASGEGEATTNTYPHKCSHCAICKWSQVCEAQRKDDDHLSLVARMRRDQIGKLNTGGVQTVVDLAAARDEQRPDGLNAETFAKLRRQATMQIRGRTEGPVYKLLEHAQWEGFGLMPAPAEGDVFFDMEGDPLYEPARGLEYLFGCWLPDEEPHFKAFWALDRAEEKCAFEQFIDFIAERRRQYPNMRVYHYADYEKSALRRLAQAHGTREQEVDDLLRGEVLIDLYAVVRQSLVISEDSYSIKRLEKFYGFKRETEVRKGDDSIVMFETWLADRTQRKILDDIERYNEDDCRSTLLLRDWLLERRNEAIAQFGTDIPFHEPKLQCHPEAVEGCRKCTERVKQEREAKQTTDLQRQLLDGILTPQTEEEYALMSDDHRARYLLGNLLAYHRREEKPVWWAFFDRCENADNLLEFDKDAIAGLCFLEDMPVQKEAKSWLYTYSFPDQHYKLGAGDSVYDPDTGKGAGTIFTLDDDENRLTIKWTGTLDEARNIRALIPGGPIGTDPQKASLTRIAESYLNGTIAPATRDLLLARDPRLCHTESNDRAFPFVILSSSKGAPSSARPLQPQTVTPDAVTTVATALDESYLFIQGPPGSGKTWTGSRVICNLLAAGKRVGVLSNGHKAMHHLLHKVEACAQEKGLSFRGLYKHTNGNGDSQYISKLNRPFIESVAKNEPFEDEQYNLAAGTAWLFSRDALTGTFDYLFIDEAGQLSLADAIAVSAAAKNVVLLGDPLQLAQVSQGVHSLHCGASVLEHLLGDAQTVPEHRGIFLDISYRMHPDICAFISDAVYTSRLQAGPKTHRQRVALPVMSGHPELVEGRLRYIPIAHEGNSRESREEAEWVVEAIVLLLQGTVTDEDAVTRPMQPDDIIVVTPYNAQRRLITKLLRERGVNVRVGTVDKFQGQEAFVVFYSMATSSGTHIPRDLGFVFEQNRFNVAISRARALSVVVSSPGLLRVPCHSAEQMALVNLLCRYVERSARREPVEA
ncbi:MAG TPA: TM0106 family RecB-like putative nuclease [Candidatus Baltobacteraceae bacterium]|nr:TM0106 family RecB-like putative nuclease [Candidatus Baltobacteraceae bacterium]